MISAKVLCHSVAPNGSELVTFEAKYPRFIHSELMTHRALSKNSASSRAIPFSKMVEAIEYETAFPAYWGAEQAGMQVAREVDRTTLAKGMWSLAAGSAIEYAQKLKEETGVHKSIPNRMLEPYAHMTVIVTGEKRGLEHFFALRAHPMAEPTFQVLAYRMLAAWVDSTPRPLEWGEWHVPFDELGVTIQRRLKIATGRVARVSYLTHDGIRDPQKDIELHDRLLAGDPPHMSPFEHCAQCSKDRLKDAQAGNFGHHWLQYRKLIPREFTAKFDAAATLAAKPDWITL